MDAFVGRFGASGCRWTPARAAVAAFAVLVWLLVTSTSADPDLWGHLRFGLDLLSTRVLPVADPYSFTSDRVWVNHEWLSELAMAVAYVVGGAAGLNVLKVAAIGAIALIVRAASRREHASPTVAAAIMLLAVFETYARTQSLRPQLFSVPLFCGVLLLMTSVERGDRRGLVALPVCFAVWVNLHGAWVVGLGAVGVWMGALALERRDPALTRRLAACGIAILVATLLNPYGIGLWRFIAETVGPSRPDVTEWKPLLALPASILIVESVLPVLALWAVARRGVHVPFRHAAVLGLLVGAAFRVSRVDAFAQAAIAILLAPQIVGALQTFASRLRQPFWRTPLPLPAAIAIRAALVLAAATGVYQLRQIAVDGAWIPDRSAAMFLKDHAHGSRVLTWFDWGEYAVWQLAPEGIRVSMDGRRETVYSQEVIAAHSAFYAGTGSAEYPDRIGADYVWLPRRFVMVRALGARGWQPVFESDVSVVLARNGGIVRRASADRHDPRVFPWP